MTEKLQIAFFGSSLVSAYWNGAATYYRGIIEALYHRGHTITFYEPDAFDRQMHRDLDTVPYARSIVYYPDLTSLKACLDEARVAEFFFKPARMLPGHRFLLGGNGWSTSTPNLANVRYLGHIYTADHNAFNATPLAVLNICRESMARFGFSPPTRIFEAAGASACIITDNWLGLGLFLEPGVECIAVNSGEEVAEALLTLSPEQAREMGRLSRQRVLAEHTYARRAEQVEQCLIVAQPVPT